MKRDFSLAGLAVVSLAMANCAGIGFEKDWDQAVADYESGVSDGVTGPWTGTWLSHYNEHTGDLRCLVTKEPGSEDLHRFRYHATWGQALKGGFNAKFPVKSDGKGHAVKGTSSLGIFGKFNHDGRIEGDTFEAKFGSKKGDYGVFEMTRPVEE